MANDLSGKRPFSINTRTVIAFREIGQGYEELQKFGTLMSMPGSLSKSYNDIYKQKVFLHMLTVLKRVWKMLCKKSGILLTLMLIQML